MHTNTTFAVVASALVGGVCAVALSVSLAAGGKNRNASDLIVEGFELCGGGVTEVVAIAEAEGGTLTATIDCGAGPNP